MSYRTFVDAEGKRWEAWLVTPAAAERRRVDRRTPAGGSVTVGGAMYEGASERRITPERRRNPFRRNLEVASEYSSGWLCFEGGGEKRRLAPVPEGWEQAGPDKLATWLQSAKRVVKCAP